MSTEDKITPEEQTTPDVKPDNKNLTKPLTFANRVGGVTEINRSVVVIFFKEFKNAIKFLWDHFKKRRQDKHTQE